MKKPRELTIFEEECIRLTVELWNELVVLEELHPDDIHEFRRDIHNIQNRIQARVFLNNKAK